MKKIIFAGVLLSLIVPSFAFAEQKAVLYFSTGSSTSYSVGQKINVSVMADPKGQTLDTIKTVITFSKDILEVQSVSMNSKFSAADPENYYSNADGIISYAAGIPGGANTSGQYLSITLLVKKTGAATLSFDSQSIILSAGENILSGVGQPLALTATEAVPAPTPNTESKPEPKPQTTVTKNAPAQPAAASTNKNTDDSGASQEKTDTALAALAPAAIPIVGQAPGENFLQYFQSKIWLLLLALLILVMVLFYFKKTGLAFLMRSAQKTDLIENQNYPQGKGEIAKETDAQTLL